MRRLLLVLVVAALLVAGAYVVGSATKDGPAGRPTATGTGGVETSTPTPSVAASSAPPKPQPAIGALTRSDAACTGTAGGYQKWAYPLTGFAPGRTLHPQLAIRSDHGDGQTAGKPVTVGPKGRGTGDFCVPAGTHGTVTITVAGLTARRPIG